jgi:hypothetical protein
VIIHVDADDALIGNNVLAELRQKYTEGADVTIGSMIRTDKHKKYPVDLVNPRSNRGGNVWQHLRTFRKHLFDRIEEEDFKISGEWISIAEDWAFMLPIVEMAEKPIYIPIPLYFYEPVENKDEETVSLREKIIEQIVNKQSYLIKRRKNK